MLHLLPDSSRVEYFITHPVSNVRNTAGLPSGEIRLAPTLQGWSISGKVTVDLRTLETGIGMRDRHVKSEEYLDVETFPLAEFEFVAAETDSPKVAVKPVADATNAGRGAGAMQASEDAVEVPVGAAAAETAGVDSQLVESSTLPGLREAAARATDSLLATTRADDVHVAESRAAESVSNPRGGVSRVDVASLPRAWKAKAVGELSLHGVTRPVEIPVELVQEGDRLRVHGTFSIFLADYKIRRPSKLLLAAGKHADITVDLLWGP